MAELLHLDTFVAESGHLTVLEKIMPGTIRRVFYIKEMDETLQTGRWHRKAWHAFVCMTGSCRIYSQDGIQENWFTLNSPQQCLLVKPADWHFVEELTPDALLLVFANEYFDPADVSFERSSLEVK